MRQPGIIIDGGGFTITGQEDSSNEQFIYFTSSDQTDLIIQNVKLEGFGNNAYYAMGGAIYNYKGTIGDISGNFSGNFAQSDSYYVYGGAIYNYKGTIGDITGDFSNNYAQSER